ncbi:hypothetical protein C3U64_06700 [Salmonella enterica subsp. enterica serovar Stanley]|nr:hypothetical protein [Salmonella enterica subsp. enterica serovar Stanley]EEA1546321.1 hypothetical protein [Salmonella enterica subsp. enterica serovar Stanley]
MSQKIDMFSLLRKHAAHIASKKDWFSDTKKTMPSLKAWLHAEQLLRLDLLLIRYREKFATVWEPLSGRRALNHLLFVRTNWPPAQISELSFDHILLILHEDLTSLGEDMDLPGLPDHVKTERDYAIHKNVPYRTGLIPCTEDEWDHTLCEIVQGLRIPE